MTKKPGIRALRKLDKKKSKKAKPVEAKKVSLSTSVSDSDKTDSNIVTELSDTTQMSSVPNGLQSRKNNKANKKEKNAFLIENKTKAKKPVADLLDEENVDKRSKRRARRSKKRILAGIKELFVTKNKQKKDDAFQFASNVKHTSKRNKRNRRIMIYAGTGLLVVVILLVVVLVPFGEAASTDNNVAVSDPTAVPTDEATPTAGTSSGTVSLDKKYTIETVSQIDSVNGGELETSPTATPTAIPTTEPTPSPTPIPTTKPDPTPIPIDVDELVDDFMVKADLYYNDVGYSTNYYEYDNDELYMLAQLIHGEARGESTKGKIAVANVVMNRVLSRGYPGSTIKSVITAKGQFTGYSSSIKPSSSCKYAARKVLDDQVWVIPQNVYFFNSHKPEGESWGSHPYYKRIGGHNFYTHRYSGRSRIDSVPPPLFERTYKWPRYGCKPEKRVYRIQYMLKGLGYDVDPDAYFGMGTVKALKKFQEKKGLEADGIAGPSTIKALIKSYGVEKFYKRFYL